MRLRVACLTAAAFVAAVFATTIKAQTTPPPRSQTPSLSQQPGGNVEPKLDQATLGKLLDHYATIAGGWYLERRCHYFARELKAEFDWNVAQTNIALAKNVNPAFLNELRESARRVAESKTCDNETRKIVLSTLVMSRDTTRLLTGQTYSPALGLAYESQMIGGLLVAQKVDDKCKVMPSHIRTEFDSRIAEISATFARSAGVGALDHMRTAAAAAFDKASFVCDEKIQPVLMSALSQARLMSPNWRAR